MCGIVGFVDHRRATDAGTLIAMRDRLAHRGPDAFGETIFSTTAAQIGLGHRRLSILDLSDAGRQPMSYGSWTLVYNGEVYNFRELAERYADPDTPYRSTSDTEVVLRAIAAEGASAPVCFVGMFAYAAYDERSNSLVLGRDRTGIKPLYYYHLDDLFLFASEPKAFYSHPRFVPEIDPAALQEYIQWGYLPGDLSIFRNVCKVPPGSTVTYDTQTREVKTDYYWRVEDALSGRNSSETPASVAADREAQLESLLAESFALRMIADVPVGVFLSGGYDSTAVTALLAKSGFENLKTFTIGFENDRGDEAPHARAIAGHLGTDHHEHYVTLSDVRQMVATLPTVFDEPFADTSAIPTLLLSRFTREHVTVSLSADAGDETFAGYGRYRRALRLNDRFSAYPGFLRTGAAALLRSFPWPHVAAATGQFDLWQRTMRLVGTLAADDAVGIGGVISRQYQTNGARHLLSRGFRTQLGGSGSFNLPSIADVSELQQLLASDYHAFLMNDVLVKVDRATMAYSLEGRDPLMDHRIYEFSARLPDGDKIGPLGGKQILKSIVHRHVPRELVERKKQGFSPPISAWLRSELRPLLERVTNRDYLARQGIFNPNLVSAMGHSFLSGRMNNVRQMWIIVAFQLWHEHWMDAA